MSARSFSSHDQGHPQDVRCSPRDWSHLHPNEGRLGQHLGRGIYVLVVSVVDVVCLRVLRHVHYCRFAQSMSARRETRWSWRTWGCLFGIAAPRRRTACGQVMPSCRSSPRSRRRWTRSGTWAGTSRLHVKRLVLYTVCRNCHFRCQLSTHIVLL